MSSKVRSFEPRQSMRRSSYEVFHYKDAHLKEVELHHHDFYEIYFFMKGNVQYNIESRSYLLNPGDVLLISPLELHQPVFRPGGGKYERMVVWINKRFLEQLSSGGQDLTQCFNTAAPGHTNLLRLEDRDRQQMTWQMGLLLEESGSQEPFGELAAMTYLVQILVMLNRYQLRQARQTEGKPAANTTIGQILMYINEHYRENLTLDHLANQFFMSKYHLSREFERLTGTTVHRYLIQKRLVMAKKLIQEGASATEASQQCGFGDYANFYRAFKGEYQISPREFAARLKRGVDPQVTLFPLGEGGAGKNL